MSAGVCVILHSQFLNKVIVREHVFRSLKCHTGNFHSAFLCDCGRRKKHFQIILYASMSGDADVGLFLVTLFKSRMKFDNGGICKGTALFKDKIKESQILSTLFDIDMLINRPQ